MPINPAKHYLILSFQISNFPQIEKRSLQSKKKKERKSKHVQRWRSDWKRNACLLKPGGREKQKKGAGEDDNYDDDDDEEEEEEEEEGGEDGPSSAAPAKGGKVNGTRCLLRYSLTPCSSPVNESKLISSSA